MLLFFPSIYFELSFQKVHYIPLYALWDLVRVILLILVIAKSNECKNTFSVQCNCQKHSVHFLISTLWNFEEKLLKLKIFGYKRNKTKYFTRLFFVSCHVYRYKISIFHFKSAFNFYRKVCDNVNTCQVSEVATS